MGGGEVWAEASQVFGTSLILISAALPTGDCGFDWPGCEVDWFPAERADRVALLEFGSGLRCLDYRPQTL